MPLSKTRGNRNSPAERSGRKTRLGRHAVILATCALAGAGAGALLLTASGKATSGGAPRLASDHVTHVNALHLKAGAKLPITTANGTTTYQPESISVSAAPIGYQASISSSAILTAFQQQTIPGDVIGSALASSTPTVTLDQVTDSRTSPPKEYTGWVIVYHNTVPQSYGPVAVAADPVCDFVGIYDLDSNQWSDYFQDCPT